MFAFVGKYFHKIGKFVNKLQFYERAYLPFQDTFELVPDYIDLNPQMLMQVISKLSPLIEGMINQFIRCKMENAPQPIKYKRNFPGMNVGKPGIVSKTHS